MEYLKNSIEAVREYVDSLSNSDLISLHNNYCQNSGSSDDEIFNNDEEFFSCYFSNVMDAVRAVSYGEYNYVDDYVIFNGYGNLESFGSYGAEQHIDKDYIVTAILEFPSDYDIELETEDFECTICGTIYDTEEEMLECLAECQEEIDRAEETDTEV